ncbi:TolC family protein [Reichenbachiella sp. MALMAid0571]|uniref:TolC family protein n=1 Tax=Reichenbachiella sp. MALMAid0571 TaxID=3143939 RepID=UPI0032DFA0BC
MKFKLLFVILFITSFYASHAQEKLSLANAIGIGLANNFSIQIEEQKKIQAANNNTWGQAGALPSVVLNASEGFSQTNINNPASFLSSGAIKSSSFNPSLTANWTLFNGFNVRMTKEKLGLLQTQTDGNAAVIVENTVQAIILAYYTVLLEKERTEVFRSTLKLSNDRYAYSKLKGELGSAVTFDILKDKNSYLTDSSNYIIQVLNHRNAVRNLNLLLGKDVDEQYLVSDSLMVEKKDFSLDELFARMTASNSNLKNQYINQEILKRDIAISKSALYPTISLNLNGSKNWQGQDLSDAVFADGSNGSSGISSSTANLVANLTLAFTLFNGGKVQNQIKNAQVQEQIGQLQIKDMELTLKHNLIGNFDTYALRKSLLDISGDNVKTSELNLQMGADRYKNGSINSFDYRDLQITYLQTALNYYQSIYDLLETEVELMRLTGGILGEYN